MLMVDLVHLNVSSLLWPSQFNDDRRDIPATICFWVQAHSYVMYPCRSTNRTTIYLEAGGVRIMINYYHKINDNLECILIMLTINLFVSLSSYIRVTILAMAT
jgi:hypothetical protein